LRPRMEGALCLGVVGGVSRRKIRLRFPSAAGREDDDE
jgi:hypothetical protein